MFIVLAAFGDIQYNIMYNVNAHTNFIKNKIKYRKHNIIQFGHNCRTPWVSVGEYILSDTTDESTAARPVLNHYIFIIIESIYIIDHCQSLFRRNTGNVQYFRQRLCGYIGYNIYASN